MLSLSAMGMPASGPGAGNRSTRSPSASSASRDQCSTALSPSAARSLDAISRATTRPVTVPPWRRGEAPGRIRPRTPGPSPPAAARGAQARACRPAAAPAPARGGTVRPAGPPALRRAERRSPRSGSSAAPGDRPRRRARPARPAEPRATPRRARCSCALPLALEARVGHEQLLQPDFLVVELDQDLEIPAGAAQALDRAAAEASVADALAFDETRDVLRGFRVARRDGGRAVCGVLVGPAGGASPARSCTAVPVSRRAPPVRRPQRCGPLLLDDAGRQRLEEARRN